MTDTTERSAKVDPRAPQLASRSRGRRSALCGSAMIERASGARDTGSSDAIFFKSLLDHSADMIAGVGEDGTILYVTPRAPRLGGGRPRIGREWLSLWPEACARALRDPLYAALNGLAGKAQVSCPDVAGRSGWWEVSFTPMPERAVRNQLRTRRSRVVVVARDISEQHEEAARATLLAQELDHRVRNMMTMLQAITRIAAGSSADFPSFIDSLEQRIHALARTHDMLCEGLPGIVDLRALIGSELRPYDDGDRVELVGAAVEVPEPRASALGLAVHELTTNAIKYGALSGAGGRLRVSWKCDGADLQIEWVESGAAINPPATAGFGSMLLEQLLADQLGIRRVWSEQGLHATLQIALPATRD